MSGSSSVQNGANWGDVDVSSNSSTVRGGVRKNGGRTRGSDKKKASIRLVNKSEYTDTYHVFYDNKKIITTVTIAGSEVDRWIEDVYKEYQDKLDKLVVGLDIEWKRIRKDGTSEENKVAVLQLCVGRRCLIFQFLGRDDEISGSLDDFLGDKRFTFVGAGIRGDAYKPLTDYDLKVAKTEELGFLATHKLTNTVRDFKGSRFPINGLKNLARDILNLDLPKKKSVQLSNWGNTYLSYEQVEYACLDAYVSFKLGMDLVERDDPKHFENSKTISEAKKVEAGKTNDPLESD